MRTNGADLQSNILVWATQLYVNIETSLLESSTQQVITGKPQNQELPEMNVKPTGRHFSCLWQEKNLYKKSEFPVKL